VNTRAREEATVFAPATVGNVAVGFDLLGHSVTSIGDTVTVRRTNEPVVCVHATGVAGLPEDPDRNTATAGLVRLRRDLGLEFGFEVHLRKGIPLGSGMGGSAASAAGAIVAASSLLDVPLTPRQLLVYGMHGEAVASGEHHADNLAPCILGGLILCRGSDPPDVVPIPVPDSLRCALVLPALELQTREARAVLPRTVTLRDHVAQSGNLAAVVAGCFAGDLELIGRALSDRIVEPHRRRLVPGFLAVQAAAMESGALGCSLSGSGPSLFAWCEGPERGDTVRDAMISAFAAVGVPARGWVSRVDAPGTTFRGPVAEPAFGSAGTTLP
jgi:homoserine kinase